MRRKRSPVGLGRALGMDDQYDISGHEKTAEFSAAVLLAEGCGLPDRISASQLMTCSEGASCGDLPSCAYDAYAC